MQDDEALKSAIAFYRLMAAWMLRLASPVAAATGGPPELPLPSPAPLEFRMLPVSGSQLSHNISAPSIISQTMLPLAPSADQYFAWACIHVLHFTGHAQGCAGA